MALMLLHNNNSKVYYSSWLDLWTKLQNSLNLYNKTTTATKPKKKKKSRFRRSWIYSTRLCFQAEKHDIEGWLDLRKYMSIQTH